jgi:hypothetical protein
MLELGQLFSFGLGMLRLWHSSRNKSHFEFLDAKPVQFPPIIKENWEGRIVGHKERILRRARVAKLTRTMLWVILLSKCAVSYHM